MATIFGTAGNDTGGSQLQGSSGDDTIYGGTSGSPLVNTGNDSINAGNGHDAVYGGDGDDTIKGGNGNDTVAGGEGNDDIDGGGGVDSITGGQGNDLLKGGGGDSDHFIYSFSVTDDVTEVSFPGFDPGTDGILTQAEFVHQYDDWLRTLGSDTNDDEAVTVENHNGSATELPEVEGFDGTFETPKENTTVKTGATTQTRYYSDSATLGNGEVVTSTDAHDVIKDFNFGGTHADYLDFSGLTKQQFLDHFSAIQQDVVTAAGVAGTDGVIDTVISITGDSTFSITLAGVSGHSLADWADYMFGA